MYYLGNDVVDSIELKCFVVSRGAKVDKQVYQKYGKNTRLIMLAATVYKLQAAQPSAEKQKLLISMDLL